MAKKSLQEKADFIDKVVTDKGTFTLSTKTVKWIIGILIFGTLTILGTSWNFKNSLSKQIDDMYIKFGNELKNMKIELIDKIEDLEKEDIKPNTKKNYEQDGSIKVLLDRTNSRDENVNRNVNRPTSNNQPPPPVL